jgi:polyisoprenoid-binding protein YceI
MKKTGTTIAAILFFCAAAFSKPETTIWSADKSHSSLKFSVTHMMMSEVEGKFKVYDGKVTSNNDEFSDATIEFTVDVNSINTDDEKRDGHLKSEEFFNTEKFPKMTFTSTSFKKVKGKK